VNIQICSLAELCNKLKTEEYLDTSIVSIRDTTREFVNAYNFLDNKTLQYRELFHTYFDDAWCNIHIKYGYKILKSYQLFNILKWAENKSNFCIQCTSGISRSPAIAYLIACKEMSPQKAMSLLNPEIHKPNPLIVKLGAKILDNYEIEKVWKKNFQINDININNPCDDLRELN
jgi:predicted protein tyrosine phosphatase